MTTGSSGAVFFLGTRAHYQVLQQPDARFDSENGNASTETIYQNPSPSLWKDKEVDSSGNYENGNRIWSFNCESELSLDECKPDIGAGVKRRIKRRSSETVLCERDGEMKPALLNNMDDGATPKPRSSRNSLFRLIESLRRRPRRGGRRLRRLQAALAACTYRESCRCLECQSRYFDCDESDEYTSDDSYEEVTRYVERALEPPPPPAAPPSDEDEDDEVFIDTVPGDNTSTDMLIEGREKMSVSSDELTEDPEQAMELEVAAGTPVLLNYLLTHPITCVLQ